MMYALVDMYEWQIKGLSHKISHLESMIGEEIDGVTLVNIYYSYDTPLVRDAYRIYYVPDCNTVTIDGSYDTRLLNVRCHQSASDAYMWAENEYGENIEHCVMMRGVNSMANDMCY